VSASWWLCFCTALLGLGLSLARGASAQAPPDGAALYQKFNCQICHGEEGRGGIRSGYPAISGQDRLYLIQQIIDIRDGARDNGQARLMRPLVEDLDDLGIQAIAKYLSSTP
jgi:cytochrome c